MPRTATKDPDLTINLNDAQVQALYLEVQQRLGILLRAAPERCQGRLKHLGVELLKVKRDWIGVYDEVESEIPLALE